MEDFALSYSPGKACFGDHNDFVVCMNGDKDDHIFCQIEEKGGHYLSGYVTINSDRLKARLKSFYAPGGYYIQFIEHNDNWLVVFKAENILAWRYMRLSKEEMEHLLCAFKRFQK